MKKIFCNFFKNDDGQAFSKIYVCFQNFMLPTATKIDLFCRGASEPSMLIIDGLMLSTDKETAELFILGSHHRQVSLFYITQNLFHNCDQFRLMSNNAHYYVVFNNKRNASQIHTLARQIYIGKEQNRIIKAYKRAAQRQWGFIVLSFAPELPDEIAVLTDYWEICPSIYL